MAPTPHPIGDQINLPFRMVMQVALQGIRMQFGRSLVTVMGVVFGTAFLMSVLATHVLRQGLAEEDRTREESSRMVGFLEAESGPVAGLEVGVWELGPLSPMEARFLDDLQTQGVSAIIPLNPGAGAPSGSSPRAIFLVGEPGGDDPVLPPDLQQMSRTSVLATTRDLDLPEAAPRILPLGREPTAEERARRLEEKANERFRTIWIVSISLLVTVIGITNAMLMRVTERFREIGTMKCLGALSSFVRRLFLVESSLMGIAGSVVGVLLGLAITWLLYSLSHGPGLVTLSLADGLGQLAVLAAGAFATGVILSIVSAIYPTSVAVRMVPADALRSNV